ncbi:hypothetical protein CAEBREN_21759 [Caenorhabditis brenneri]|uniref:Uncharacterized protein n=1 Tax=Caenorhabditis brenneri TaxID=135651 RepID=G0MMF8_CAEBE|nr:hypothetical protein CAEBREN_21759 [Caenorhabditis brenneri]
MSLLALDDIIPLIENWIETPREIGKCFCFEVRKTPLREAMAAVRQHFDGIKTEKSIEIPVNNFSQIKVSYEDDEIEDWDRPLRLLTIEVKAV